MHRAAAGSALAPEPWTALILAGGRATRLGGIAKSEVTINGTSLLETLLASLPADVPVIVAGPKTSTARPVMFRTEDQPFGGPVSGIAAALPAVATPIVVILAVDMPRAGELASTLAEACVEGTDAVIPIDLDDRPQPLSAAYRTSALHRELALSTSVNRAMRDVVNNLVVTHLKVEHPDLLDDIDTVDDLRRARGRRDKGAGMLDTWVAAVQAELGLDTTIDVDGLLDVARVAAHNVERPAAPLTMYLMGLAVGAGQNPADVAARIQRLAADWTP